MWLHYKTLQVCFELCTISVMSSWLIHKSQNNYISVPFTTVLLIRTGTATVFLSRRTALKIILAAPVFPHLWNELVFAYNLVHCRCVMAHIQPDSSTSSTHSWIPRFNLWTSAGTQAVHLSSLIFQIWFSKSCWPVRSVCQLEVVDRAQRARRPVCLHWQRAVHKFRYLSIKHLLHHWSVIVLIDIFLVT